MNIIVNNKSHAVESQSLSGLIEELAVETKGVAIALNNRVIPRDKWGDTSIVEGDKIVIVSAVFGG